MVLNSVFPLLPNLFSRKVRKGKSAKAAERCQRREKLATMNSKPNSKLETRNSKLKKVNLSCGISCE